jgi:hypothetical protein
MTQSLKSILWNQFGASLDMLENAIEMCPPKAWNTENKFWYNAYHCLFFLDYYLTIEPVHFAPPAPFTLSEFEDEMPERVYTKAELLTYLTKNKQKCYDLIQNLNTETRWINESKTMDYPIVEILLYNMRHVQHHAAQLNLILRQDINEAPHWICREGEN